MTLLQVLLGLAIIIINVSTSELHTPYPICDSPIFCQGELLSTVQRARLFDDSKTFVDMKLKDTPERTLSNFRAWQLANPSPSAAAIGQFVADNFDPEGSEFQPWAPADYRANPAFLRRIVDPTYRQFASDLNDKWAQLGRNMTDDVARNPHLYSIIHVPNPVIVPGVRFREFYYWDSYWIIRGLLHSEMYQTVRGMLVNYLSIVERYGFIPNGGRIYYLGRSQPPLLISMVEAYVDATGDLDFVRQSVGLLEREFAYWMDDEKTVRVRGHRLSRYTSRSTGPRPEAYAEDLDYARAFDGNATAAAHFYAEMKAAAESGMDFSSRWFIRNGTNEGTLVDTQCQSIVPVELNAVLHWDARTLYSLHMRLGNFRRAAYYQATAARVFAAIQAVLWHADVGAWLDWDLVNERRRDHFVPTNLAPLWTGSFNRLTSGQLSQQVLRYLRRYGVDGYPAGVPNTLQRSGEQWDFPNAWPPMQHMLIAGLENLRTREASATAFELAEKWVHTNWVAYNRTASMFEKYSATEIGVGGDGGEYEVQLGFGWSNGVVLDLLERYGSRLRTRREGL